jgi:serine/threonine protein kinase
MKDMSFPSIVNYIECFLLKKKLWIVMEYLEGGALTDVVSETFMDECQIDQRVLTSLGLSILA